MHRPDLSDAYGRSAAGTKAGAIGQFCSAIFTGQDRRPPGYPDGKLSADSWLGKEIRGPAAGRNRARQ
jgi:hypothetical protein